ncbi:MAG TPA: PAS domain-containing sensor histidine kinase [Spongiibacteraceae bacterium]|nr:PAS domain-containing sensor histidine kinase [Spongiibacteraceae bacterium]HCS27209.1 PAS domain-containing sensor histidine kinase [Spongiibacteraceae bacterium]
MPLRGWKTELARLGLLLVVAAFFGLILDLLSWFMIGTVLAYALWSINQLRLLNRWLFKGRGQEPPEAAGLWGQVFDTLSQMQRENERVTARLRASIEHLRSSFASMADAVVMLTPDGNIEWSNQAAHTLLGLRHPDDNGRLLVNLLREPEFIRFFESGDYRERLSIASPVNGQIKLSISVSVFGQASRLLFARDVTRTVQLEQMRKDFVANVSHELRTPLTVITGYLEMLADQPGNTVPVARALDQMSEQSRRMQSLIQDLMTLSRLEAVPSARHADSIALKPLMDSIRDEIQLAAVGERKLSIECDEGLRLQGDFPEIQSAFSNLASNAARYTGPGDSITLRWYADRDHAYFEVQDTGIGIEPQHVPRLTERFYRVDQSRSTETGGTGLGLAIVKHILLRHHAELRIRSYPGRGSTFCCVFPLSAVTRRDA